MNAKPKKLIKKSTVLIGIRNGIKEVRESKQKGETLQTLTDFLSEGGKSVK